jgi:hypothetical protein
MSDLPLPGPLDDFLNHPPASPHRAERRRELLRQTATHLLRRRRMHRLKSYAMSAATAVLLILFVFGVVHISERVRQWGQAVDNQTQVQPRAPQHDEPPVAEGPPRQPAAPPDEKTPPARAEQGPSPAVVLEWKAFDAPRAERAALYFQAGDRYLEDGRDVASAMRCYNVAIDATPNTALEIQPDDNWLVTTLKLDQIERRKER